MRLLYFSSKSSAMKSFRAFCSLLTFSLLWFTQTHASAQNSDNRPENSFMDRVFFGGGLGLQFGTLTLIDVSPVVGYRITERFEAGLGFTYKYYKYNDYYVDLNTGTSYDLKSDILGGSVFGRYHITESIFAHAEYETLNYRYEDYYSYGGNIMSDKRTAIINSFFIGGGYRQHISEGSYFFIMALWNLNDGGMSPYSNPVLRMGVILGR